MAEVSEGLRDNRKWFLLVNKSSPSLKQGLSHGISPMRMRRLQNTKNAMQRRWYQPIVASLTINVCVPAAILRDRVCSNHLRD